MFFKIICIPLEYLLLYTFTNTSARAGYNTRSIFKRVLTGLNSEFSFSLTSCLNKAEEPSLPYIAGGKIIGFIPFPRVLVLCEMQPILSRIWTRVTVSLSYDDNHYTTDTEYLLLYNCKLFVQVMVTWRDNCIQRIIISYVKPYTCASRND